MKNQKLANIFYGIASYLEMDKVPFKPYAYQKAAITIETLEEDIVAIYRKGGKPALKKIPSIGKNIAESIEEYIKTGKIKYYEDFKKKLPINIEELIAVEGMGARKAKLLYQKLKIRNVKDLEKAAKKHKIAPLFGFGEKTEKNILEGIAFLKRDKGRYLLGQILPEVKEIITKLKKLKEVEQISTAGSVRRMKETIGDVDILVTTKKPQKVMDSFTSLPGVVKVWSKGTTKSSIRMRKGFDVDLRVVQKKSYGSALQYFTGSKEHNINTRKVAIGKGLKLNEYGIFRGKRMIAGWSESGVYKALGLPWMEPEIREDHGEVEAGLRGRLPKLIGFGDIKGDLHCHSKWDGGVNSIEKIAEASQKIGYQYVGIADHTKFLRIEHGLDERRLAQRDKEIDKLNNRYRGFKVLKGAETNILRDGSIDIKDEALKKLDFVIAGVHSSFKLDESAMTERIIKAMKNPHVDILSHPTGRLIKKRDEYQIDFDRILRAAKQYNVVLEINAYPERLDLNDFNIRRAREAGVKMVINTDAHHIDQLGLIEFGIAQARRGWAEKKDIINTQSLDKLLSLFN